MHANLLSRRPSKVAVIGGSLLAAVAVIITAASAYAATTPAPTGQALEIGPPVVNLTADPGKKVVANLSLRDVSSSSLVVTNEIDDFTASGEDGTPKIATDGTTSPYSLKTWITPIPSVNLKPRDVKTIPVTITVPANAAPGGYYGVIRFTGAAPQLQDTGVSLNASLGALIFIRVTGAATEKAEIASFTTEASAKSSSFFETIPVDFVVRIKNAGNIYEQPTGLVTIKDTFGHVTATLPINADQLIILPQTIRKFSQPLDNTVVGNRMLFGRYTAHLDVTYGTNGQKLSKDISFWVIPYKLVLFAVILIMVAVTALIIFIKRYNKMIVRRAQKRK